MDEYSAFDQYNHYPSAQAPQEAAAPPRRARYGRRSSVTQYNLASYQPQQQQTQHQPQQPHVPDPAPPRQRVARRCSVTQYNLYTQPLSAPKPSVVSPETPQRQRYRRRSSVTQYNLESYQQQQQANQPHAAPAQEVTPAEQQEPPRQRYRRRSSVTQYNLESYLQQQAQQQSGYHAPQPHATTTTTTLQDVTPPTETAEPPRQRYRRRSSVTQYNLESYQQQQLQQQQDQMMRRTQEVVVQPPSVSRYPRRSSVTQYNLADGVTLTTPPFEVSYSVDEVTEDEGEPAGGTSLNASVYPDSGFDDTDDDDEDYVDDDNASHHSADVLSLGRSMDGLSIESSVHMTRSTTTKEPSMRDVFGVSARRGSLSSFVSGEDLMLSGMSSAASLSSFPTRRSSIQFGSSSRRGSITSAPAPGDYARAASFRISKQERRLSLQPSDVIANSFMNSSDIVADYKLDGTDMVGGGGADNKSCMSFTAVSGQLSFDCSFSSLAGAGSGIGSVVGVQ